MELIQKVLGVLVGSYRRRNPIPIHETVMRSFNGCNHAGGFSDEQLPIRIFPVKPGYNYSHYAPSCVSSYLAGVYNKPLDPYCYPHLYLVCLLSKQPGAFDTTPPVYNPPQPRLHSWDAKSIPNYIPRLCIYLWRSRRITIPLRKKTIAALCVFAASWFCPSEPVPVVYCHLLDCRRNHGR